MTARKFSEVTERYGSTWRTVARLTCRKCGVSDSIGLASVGGLMPPNIITKKMEQRGWSIGPNDQWDYCPGCSQKQVKTMTPLKVVHQEPEKATDKPREMSRDDRRLIFSKLDEVYLDEKRGYVSGWSDHKIASDLGVPRKWVEIIRNENFGALGTNEDMQTFLTEAEALCKQAREALDEARKHREHVEQILKSPQFLTLPSISDRLSKVEKLAAEVRKLVVVG